MELTCQRNPSFKKLNVLLQGRLWEVQCKSESQVSFGFAPVIWSEMRHIQWRNFFGRILGFIDVIREYWKDTLPLKKYTYIHNKRLRESSSSINIAMRILLLFFVHYLMCNKIVLFINLTILLYLLMRWRNANII